MRFINLAFVIRILYQILAFHKFMNHKFLTILASHQNLASTKNISFSFMKNITIIIIRRLIFSRSQIFHSLTIPTPNIATLGLASSLSMLLPIRNFSLPHSFFFNCWKQEKKNTFLSKSSLTLFCSLSFS